jgi:hypothetical protein
MLILATIGALLAALSGQPQRQLDLPKDFSIHFEFGLCWRDVVDTRSDRYVRDLATGSGATRTVRLRLSDAQRRQLATWVDDSHFFDLPKQMDSSVAKDGTVIERIPSENYLIEIRRAGLRHVVEFDDNGDALSEHVQRVRTLVQRLERFFSELPQVKVLPKPAVGCA